jgi:hypothetical protein
MLKLFMALDPEGECEQMVIMAIKCPLCLENAANQSKITIYK